MNLTAILKRHKNMQLVLMNRKQPTGDYVVSCEAILMNDRGEQKVSVGKFGCFDGKFFTEQVLENMLDELDTKACDFEREAEKIKDELLGRKTKNLRV